MELPQVEQEWKHLGQQVRFLIKACYSPLSGVEALFRRPQQGLVRLCGIFSEIMFAKLICKALTLISVLLSSLHIRH